MQINHNLEGCEFSVKFFVLLVNYRNFVAKPIYVGYDQVKNSTKLMPQSENKSDCAGIICGVTVILGLIALTCVGLGFCACPKHESLLKHELLMSNGMGSQFEATGRGHDSVCFDCKYSQAVFMTSCVRNESEQTGSCGSAEDYCPKKGKVLQQECGKTAETIAGWRRLCRLLSRKYYVLVCSHVIVIVI